MKIKVINDIEAKIEAFIDIAEHERLKYRPDDSPETRERSDDLLTYYPNTNFGTDVIFASNEEGKAIAFTALLKTEALENPWLLAYNVYPEYDTKEVANLLFPEIMRIAKDQNAPGLIAAHRKNQTELEAVIQSLKFIAYNFFYAMKLQNLDNLPQITRPTGISFTKGNEIEDMIQYVKVMNEAYKNFDRFVPETPDTIKNWITMDKKRFEISHYFAFTEKTMVGICSSLDNLDVTRNQRIENLGVLEKYRNKGIGSALMNMALHDLHQKGRKNVELFRKGKDPSVIGLPLKFGFEVDNANSQVLYRLKDL